MKSLIKTFFLFTNNRMPEMTMKFDDKLLESINPTVVENKPEAPWIKITSEGAIFTKMFKQQKTLTQNQKQDQKKQSQITLNFYNLKKSQYYAISKYDHNEIDQQDDIVEQQPIVDLRQLKQESMLDSKIADKLNSILQKKALN